MLINIYYYVILYIIILIFLPIINYFIDIVGNFTIWAIKTILYVILNCFIIIIYIKLFIILFESIYRLLYFYDCFEFEFELIKYEYINNYYII